MINYWQGLPEPRHEAPLDWHVIVDTTTRCPVTEPFTGPTAREDALLWIAEASEVNLTDTWRIVHMIEVTP